MNIAIGADHRGFMHKKFIMQYCIAYDWIDVGTYDEQRTDYPLYTKAVVDLLVAGTVDCGVLLCGTGIGMAIAANRYSSVYAGVVWNTEIVKRAKEEDNINILVLPADIVSAQESVDMINVWLATAFKGGRYAERLTMIQ